MSGVLAAVTAGIYLGWLAPRVSTAQMRMEGVAVWEFIHFLLNAVLFMLIGLQLPSILDRSAVPTRSTLAGYALATIATVIGDAFLWLFTTPYILRLVDRRPSQVRAASAPPPGWSWHGRVCAGRYARGGSRDPAGDRSGAPFPDRDLVIFLAYSVVLFTVVVQGLTLPALIRRLGVVDDGSEEEAQEHGARIAAAEAALDALDVLAEEEWTREDSVERMRGSTRSGAGASPRCAATSRTRTGSPTGRSPTSA